MRRVVIVSVFAALFVCPAVIEGAETSRDLQVPTAALSILELPLDQGLPLAMLRAIRILHSVAHDVAVPQMASLEQLLTDVDRLEGTLSNAGSGGLSLAMAKTNTERGVLKQALEAVGLRLREQRNTYTVNTDPGKDAIAVRARLQKIGIDATSLAKRLNAGESVLITTSITALPLPLSPDVWSSVVFERSVPEKTLFATIVRDRRASLLYYGLQAMTPNTLAYVARNPDLLRSFYRDAAGPFAAFGGSFQIDEEGRVVVPDGADGVELWQSLVDEPITRPDQFGRALFSRDSGRLAYFFDGVLRLDEPHRRFALGLWITDRGARLERFRALYQTFIGVEDRLSFTELPFLRPSYDPPTLLGVVAVTPSGAPAAPAFKKLWSRAFESDDIPGVNDRIVNDPEEEGSIDAAWLAERLVAAKQRRQFIDQFAFGQRLFSTVSWAELPHVLVALRGFVRFPAAMLTLERIGVREPKVYAAAARRALSFEQIEDDSESVPLLAQFQGGLAILDRLARTGAVAREALEELSAALIALEVTEHRYEGRVGQWIDERLVSSLTAINATTSVEERLLAALSDQVSSRDTFAWEGETYVLDDAPARRELAAVRKKQGGNTLDALLKALRPAQTLVHGSPTIDQVKTLTSELNAAAATLVPPRAWPDAPDGVPDSKKIIERVIRNLGRLTKPQDAGKAAREVVPFIELLDYLLGETLVALDYTPLVGDARSLVGSTTDMSHRHTFGVSLRSRGAEPPRRTAWRRPSPGSSAVGGDAVTGSLLGIDLALASKTLRRIATDTLPGPPRLNTNDAAMLIGTVGLLNPRHMDGAQLTAIGAALARGRERVRAAAGNPATRDALAVSARMSSSRRQLLTWAADHVPNQMERLFSVSEMFWIGVDPALDRTTIDAWGMSFEPMTGCFCLRFPPAGSWDAIAGRESTPQLAFAIADVNLRVAGLLSETNVPAPLFAGVMRMAMRDYLDTVPALYFDDWEAISTHAWSLTRERVEDYVSALVASGPVRVASSEAGQ